MQTVHLAVKCTVDKVRVCTFSSFVIFSFFDQLGFIMLTFKYSLSHVINFTNIMCTCTLLYKLKSCFQVMVRKNIFCTAVCSQFLHSWHPFAEKRKQQSTSRATPSSNLSSANASFDGGNSCITFNFLPEFYRVSRMYSCTKQFRHRPDSRNIILPQRWKKMTIRHITCIACPRLNLRPKRSRFLHDDVQNIVLGDVVAAAATTHVFLGGLAAIAVSVHESLILDFRSQLLLVVLDAVLVTATAPANLPEKRMVSNSQPIHFFR